MSCIGLHPPLRAVPERAETKTGKTAESGTDFPMSISHPPDFQIAISFKKIIAQTPLIINVKGGPK
jgi:hypothetical protein